RVLRLRLVLLPALLALRADAGLQLVGKRRRVHLLLGLLAREEVQRRARRVDRGLRRRVDAVRRLRVGRGLRDGDALPLRRRRSRDGGGALDGVRRVAELLPRLRQAVERARGRLPERRRHLLALRRRKLPELPDEAERFVGVDDGDDEVAALDAAGAVE